MTITQDSQWYDLPTQADEDALKASREKRRAAYWNKERLEEFWGRNPTQEFNDRVEDDVISQEVERFDNDGFTQIPKKIRRFPSGAVRSDDTGRIRPDYLSPYALAEIASHFTVAKNDFGPTNYFKGIQPKDILPSVMRHMLEFQEGVMNNDKDMVRSALRSLGANAIMGLHQIVMEERGEYVEKYDKVELVDIEYALKDEQ